MTTDSQIQQAITATKASFARATADLERLYALKHEKCADAHGDALTEATKARRAAETEVERAKARITDLEARAGRAEKRAADLELALARAKAEAAGVEETHLVERNDRDRRLNEASARVAALEARLAAAPLVTIAPITITAAAEAPQG